MSAAEQYFVVYESEFKKELHKINEKIESQSQTNQKSFVIDVENAISEASVAVIRTK